MLATLLRLPEAFRTRSVALGRHEPLERPERRSALERRNGQKYAAAFGHDPDAIFQDLLRLQAQHPGKLVHFPPRRPPVVHEPQPMRSRPGDKAAV